MILYPGSGIEVIKDLNVGSGNEVSVITLKNEFGGEHCVRSRFYILSLWLVSFWAMITNFIQVIFRKIFTERHKSFNRIMWDIGRDSNHISSTFVDRFSRYNHESKYGAAGWRSLNIFYNYNSKIKPFLNGNFEGMITRYWIEKMENRQAVTNRLKVVVNLLEETFLKFIHEPEIRLISVASGSAQAVIEAMLRCRHLNIKVILVDIDKSALKEARQSVKEAGLEDHFEFVRGTTRKLNEISQNFQPHIIEMVGFLDYRPDDKAITLINSIYQCLEPNGIFLTCNIRKNREKPFLDWVLLWPMIYRSEKQFAKLLLGGGFNPTKTEIIYEPFKIHGIGVCQK